MHDEFVCLENRFERRDLCNAKKNVVKKRSRRTFQCRMKEKTSNPDEQIAQVRHEENCIMLVPVTIRETFVGQVHEEDIGETIHDFCRVDCRIVILSWQVSKHGQLISKVMYKRPPRDKNEPRPPLDLYKYF